MTLLDLIRMGLPRIFLEGAAARRRDLERLFEVTQAGRRAHDVDYEDVVEQFAREDFERVLASEPWKTLYSLPAMRNMNRWLRAMLKIKPAEEGGGTKVKAR